MSRRYPLPLVAFAVSLLVVLGVLFTVALAKGEEPCGVTTPAGATCVWPGYVAAEDAQGQGYRQTYVLLAVGPIHDIDPEYFVDPAGVTPRSFTWTLVRRFTAPGQPFPYTERLMLDYVPYPDLPRALEPR